jgi:hypothetical protein
MATANAPQPLAAPFDGTVLLHGLDEILAATGIKSANLGQRHADSDLIQTHRQDEQCRKRRAQKFPQPGHHNVDSMRASPQRKQGFDIPCLRRGLLTCGLQKKSLSPLARFQLTTNNNR